MNSFRTDRHSRPRVGIAMTIFVIARSLLRGNPAMTRLFVVLLIAFLLRTIALGSYPIGLYSDEAAFGYNAYLLLKTGHDEYGRFWPVSFESFGDWKPPMQGWLAIPLIVVFGLTEFAVRLPSALLGTATVAVIYFLAKNLLRPGLPGRPGLFKQFPLIAALLLAINPWHIFMSRSAMLVSVEVFFISLGVLALILGKKSLRASPSDGRSVAISSASTDCRVADAPRNDKSHFEVNSVINWWWIMAAISFSGAIYSYYGSRVTVPLILISFLIVYYNELKIRWRELIFPLMAGLLLLSPLVIQSIKEPSILTGRAKTTSVFFNDNVRLQLWDAHTKAGLKKIPPLISRFIDNKPYYYARDIAQRYFSHLSPEFLFLKGDSRNPFKIPRLGYLHFIDLPFLLVGLYFLRKEKQTFLLLYFLVTPFVAALTFLTPAGNRSFNMVIPWTLITAYGIAGFLAISGGARSLPVRLASLRSPAPDGAGRSGQAGRSAKQPFNHPAIKILIGFYLISFIMYAYSYLALISNEIPDSWHYGRKELSEKLRPLLPQYENIYLSNGGGPPYIFLAFYLKVPPEEFYRTVKRNPVINNLGWGHVDGLLNITIPREFDWDMAAKDKRALYVGFETEIPAEDVDIVSQVYYPNGKVAHRIATLKQ